MNSVMLIAICAVSGQISFGADVSYRAEVAKPVSFRGVFRHQEKTKSITIWADSIPRRAEARIKDVRVHVEQGCLGYHASGYLKGSQLVLLPISDVLGEEIAEALRPLGIESFQSFDMAALICHLDEEQTIESVDVVLPDLTIYRVKRDYKTPHDR